MKTSHQTTTIKCEEQQNYSLLYLFLYKLWQSLKSGMNSACQAASVGLNAKHCLQQILLHKRIACGVTLILIAPLFLIAYKLFDSTVNDTSWYYTGLYWYMYVIGPYICLLLWSVGALLLFPIKSKLKYFTVILPASISIGALIHHTFFVVDYDSYHNPSWVTITLAPAFALSILMCADYMLYRKFHLNDGNLTRINGIIRTPGIPADQKLQILETLIEERQNFYARV